MQCLRHLIDPLNSNRQECDLQPNRSAGPDFLQQFFTLRHLLCLPGRSCNCTLPPTLIAVVAATWQHFEPRSSATNNSALNLLCAGGVQDGNGEPAGEL
jgi:hypothetical protein